MIAATALATKHSRSRQQPERGPFRHHDAMTLAAAPFNQTLFVTLAGVIPLLFIGVAVEGPFIKGLIDAFTRAGETWFALAWWLLAFGPLIRKLVRPSSARQPERESRKIGARLILAAAGIAATAPAVVAVLILATGTASEIIAILAIYHQNAAPWMSAFTASGAIALAAALAISPAIALIRATKALLTTPGASPATTAPGPQEPQPEGEGPALAGPVQAAPEPGKPDGS